MLLIPKTLYKNRQIDSMHTHMKSQIPYYHPAWIEIDVAQFKKNIAILKQQLSNSLLCLPVKANAYGHGLVEIGTAAQEYGVDYLAVSCLQEGARLREAGIHIPILVMGAIHEDQVRALIEHNLEVTVASSFKADLLTQVCQQFGLRCRVHLEVDTGMQRTGMRKETALTLLKSMLNNPYLTVRGAYSHLATADHKNDRVALQQISQFQDFVEQAKRIASHKMIFHVANSGGLINYPQALFDMVRPGILAYGYYDKEVPAAYKDIKPFLSLKAKIAYFKVVEAGQGVSYGHHYKTPQTSRVVTIPVGYGDGYRRSLSTKASVLIRGKRYPIIGAICMDQLMVNIGNDEAYVGDEAVLVGGQGDEMISIHEIASLCDTIAYEILCAFNQRLPRTYVQGLAS